MGPIDPTVISLHCLYSDFIAYKWHSDSVNTREKAWMSTEYWSRSFRRTYLTQLTQLSGVTIRAARLHMMIGCKRFQPVYVDWRAERQLRWAGLADYKVCLKLPPLASHAMHNLSDDHVKSPSSLYLQLHLIKQPALTIYGKCNMEYVYALYGKYNLPSRLRLQHCKEIKELGPLWTCSINCAAASQVDDFSVELLFPLGLFSLWILLENR